MGVLFSKPKKSEEPRSRADSQISLQKVNMREPGAGAEENQILLQENLNQNLNPRYESIVVTIRTKSNTPIAKEPEAKNYHDFLTPDLLGKVLSFCSMTELLQMRQVSRSFLMTIQNYNEDDHVSLLQHIISFISTTRLFSYHQEGNYQLRLILFSRSSTATRIGLITNPLIGDNEGKGVICIVELCILLRNALKRGSLFPIIRQDVGNALNSLSNIDKNIKNNMQEREQRLLSFRVVNCISSSLTALLRFVFITVAFYCIAAIPIGFFYGRNVGDIDTPKGKVVMISSTSLLFCLFLVACCCHHDCLCYSREDFLLENFPKIITATKEEQRAIFEKLKDDIQFFKNKLNPPTEEEKERTDSIAVSIPINRILITGLDVGYVCV